MAYLIEGFNKAERNGRDNSRANQRR